MDSPTHRVRMNTLSQSTNLSISCSFSSSSLCRWITDSMIFRSSSVRWLRSGIGGRDGRLFAVDIVCSTGGVQAGYNRYADKKSVKFLFQNCLLSRDRLGLIRRDIYLRRSTFGGWADCRGGLDSAAEELSPQHIIIIAPDDDDDDRLRSSRDMNGST